MFFSFSPTEILYISSRVLFYVFRFNFSFCLNNGLEKKNKKKKQKQLADTGITWLETRLVLEMSLLAEKYINIKNKSFKYFSTNWK